MIEAMILAGVFGAGLFLAIVAVMGALDRRDSRRRDARLAEWYRQNGG